MESILASLRENNKIALIRIADIYQLINHDIIEGIDNRIFDTLLEKLFIPQYDLAGEQYCLIKDVEIYFSLTGRVNKFSYRQERQFNSLFPHASGKNGYSDLLIIEFDVNNSIVIRIEEIDHEEIPAIKNVLKLFNDRIITEVKYHTQSNNHYLKGTTIKSNNVLVHNYITAREKNIQSRSINSASEFARSAHYMGSKKSLAGFIIDSIYNYLSNDVVIFDIMCGSGAASGVFSRYWETVASDAQQFSQKLAIVQGGGVTREQAHKLSKSLLDKAREHANGLKLKLMKFIEDEELILVKDINEELIEEFKILVKKYPLYSSGRSVLKWNPDKLVKDRQKERKKVPYILFTTYFANVFFGIRQAIEIDSLRYAIDQLRNELERNWALGALVATVSSIGSTYAAHFAQPLVKNIDTISSQTLAKIIEKRSLSIFHEFDIRLLNLSKESEKTEYPIVTIEGPWQVALSELKQKYRGRKIIVYLDPPYKREEYSRYYHVLETLVRYTYPSVSGKGRLPSKGSSERFSSEFFTRDIKKIENKLSEIICSIISEGWVCVWSYSNTGTANIANVIGGVSSIYDIHVESSCIPYVHKSQGGGVSKKVMEYIVILKKR